MRIAQVRGFGSVPPHPPQSWVCPALPLENHKPLLGTCGKWILKFINEKVQVHNHMTHVTSQN